MIEPSVAVVIPNLHSPVIGEVLRSLFAETEHVNNTVEIWVIGQDCYNQVQANKAAHFLETPDPLLPSQARNLGASVTSSDVLIFLDADCVPQPGWLAIMLAAYQFWPEAGAISGAMLADAESFSLHCGQIAGFHEHLNLNRSGPRRLLASFSLLMTRQVWKLVGGFDPTLKIAEDVDLSVRLHQLGRPLYLESRAQVMHRPQRGGWRTLWRHAFIGGQKSVYIRARYSDWFGLPRWSLQPWVWRLLSPAIAVSRTLEIYAATPGLWRYWKCFPWVLISKLAWCWGAALGLGKRQDDPLFQSGEKHD